MILPADWKPILAAFAAGELSAPVALSRLLLAGAGVEAPDQLGVAARSRAELIPLAALAEAVRDRLPALVAMVQGGLDPDGLTGTRAHFDRLARTLPDAGVALYTFGDPMLLAEATAELVAVIEQLSPVEGRDLLDFGSGTGRLARALAERGARVVGLDVAPAMVEEARRRGGQVSYHVADGHSLVPLADHSLDVAIAADSLPYVVRAGQAVLAGLFAEFARVLRPGGDFLVFNWSYRGQAEEDRAEAERLAQRHGFALLSANDRPFRLWDAAAFHLRRAP